MGVYLYHQIKQSKPKRMAQVMANTKETEEDKDMMERAQQLINKLNFDELAKLATDIEGIDLLPMIMDRMELLDEERFIEFASNF